MNGEGCGFSAHAAQSDAGTAPQDQFTKEEALREAVLENGGALLLQDDSYQPAADASTAAAAAASGGGGAPATPDLPGAVRRQLLLRVFQDSDHFWLMQGSAAADYVVGWLETLLRPAAAAVAAGEGDPVTTTAVPPPAATKLAEQEAGPAAAATAALDAVTLDEQQWLEPAPAAAAAACAEQVGGEPAQQPQQEPEQEPQAEAAGGSGAATLPASRGRAPAAAWQAAADSHEGRAAPDGG
jgi:hypothetical protein